MKTMRRQWRKWLAAALLWASCRVPANAIELGANFDTAEPRTPPRSVAASFATRTGNDPVPAPMLRNESPVAPMTPAPDTVPQGPTGGTHGSICEPTDDGRFPWCSEECPRFGFVTSGGFESWRGVSDAANEGNFGYVSSFNLGMPLLDDFGLGGQFGMSHGVYDWMGRTGNGNNEANRLQQQWLFTYGVFRRACGTRFQGGFAQDWMVNDNFGNFSQEPTLSQFRAQLGFVLNPSNEIGVNLTHRDRSATQEYFNPVVPVTYSAINTTSLFWHRKWCSRGTDSWIWWGVPSYRRLNQAPGAGGSLGEFTLGGALNVPVTARIAAYAHVNYMKPSARGGIAGSQEEFFDLGFGLSFVPGGTRTNNVTGQRWMPLMPVANNGNFLVDRSL